MKKIVLSLFLTIMILSTGCAGHSKAAGLPGPFEYGEIYLPEHDTEEYRELGLFNLDDEWGIWGHNLAVVLPEKPSQTIYAKIGPHTDREQYCFTSDKLYEYIEDYIVNNYAAEDSMRFAILPNDNGIVCQCATCVEVGNTTDDSSPAIQHLIRKLAKRFPSHVFFTSSYKSAKSLPNEPLPANSGVLVSAIDLPLSASKTPAEDEFENLLRSWSGKTGHLYVWDYINNFDDYFTPFPVFGPMQRRLQLYERAGVKGLFLNGSGTDYSSMSRLKTHVLRELMVDPNADWRSILSEKSKEFYPVTGDLISSFMIEQEDYLSKTHGELPLYGGITAELPTYLPEETFMEFHKNLKSLSSKTSGDEKKEVEKLINALELTNLEIMRSKGEIVDYEQHLQALRKLDNENVHVYSEICWTITSYADDFEYLAKHYKETKNNKLKGKEVYSLTALDPDYTDMSVVTDGVLGMPSNYHNGLLINSPEGKWNIVVPHVPGMKKLKIWLVSNPAFKIGIPKMVELSYLNDRLLAINRPSVNSDRPGHTCIEFDITTNEPKSLVIGLTPDPNGQPSIAIDEIEGF